MNKCIVCKIEDAKGKYCNANHKRFYAYYSKKGFDEKQIQEIFEKNNSRPKRKETVKSISLIMNPDIINFYNELSIGTTRTAKINELIKNNFNYAIGFNYHTHLRINEPNHTNFSIYLYPETVKLVKVRCVKDIITVRMALKIFLYNYFRIFKKNNN